MDNPRQPTDRQKPKRRLWFWLGAAGLPALSYLLFASTPDTVGPLGITTFFIILALTIFFNLMWLRSKVFQQPSSLSLLMVILISVLGTGALALNTIELQAAEILLLVAFGAMLSVYWLKVR